MITRHALGAAALAALIAACGGSGSTGLVSPEGALLQQARREGTCVTSSAMVTYCATDSPNAVSPGGASAAGPLAATPQPTPTAAGNGATPSPAFSATPGPVGSATPIVQPTPCAPGDGNCPVTSALRFTVRGLPPGAECALAARLAGTSAAWATGALVAAGGATATIEAPLPAAIEPGLVEVALLCFEAPPSTLAPTLAELADADPAVVFAPAQPVTVAAP